eukprot:scaffold1944_cov241-Pinguiococcus_pyrenoidosus.AAC.11
MYLYLPIKSRSRASLPIRSRRRSMGSETLESSALPPRALSSQSPLDWAELLLREAARSLGAWWRRARAAASAVGFQSRGGRLPLRSSSTDPHRSFTTDATSTPCEAAAALAQREATKQKTNNVRLTTMQDTSRRKVAYFALFKALARQDAPPSPTVGIFGSGFSVCTSAASFAFFGS